MTANNSTNGNERNEGAEDDPAEDIPEIPGLDNDMLIQNGPPFVVPWPEKPIRRDRVTLR